MFDFSWRICIHIIHYMYERKSYTLSHLCVQYQLPYGVVGQAPT